ncbi:thiosulfate sulfurtransferase GlpE [Alkalimonas sp. MEB108]|uniref:Thiosulfate sulfurtransferase GlpE n=1 Tax=Alkalimonas cellulosilytica TaxID=3058395 RepID=A0ABU7J3T7_9GAMM|nr:thiosulfate sulfurtransferase GlpE [Alkalimonas sp. MEB108]MEE2001156.1 thiosulfate sulfurtransferase GlpE [Alkalimonas sp. MEB108]
MFEFKHISVADTASRLQQRTAVIADIRDEQSYAAGHIAGAWHLTSASLPAFMQQHDFATPVVVVCYHGNSSQGAAQYLAQQGFDEVYSMDGGMALWQQQHPVTTAND